MPALLLSLSLINDKFVLMKIGFDAKRAYNNNTGLGHYSRTLIAAMATDYPENEYVLFTPALSELFDAKQYRNMQAITPSNTSDKIFRKNWRSRSVIHDLKKTGIDLYHGLSHQVPVGIDKTGIASVVTIHDLIFERYPEQHGRINVLLYRKKFTYACNHADAVIAISRQTKQDLLDLYHVPEEKIYTCYQSCDPSFAVKLSAEEKERIRQKYGLPERFFLSVGSVTERKNLLTICKAMNRLKDELQIPLVVIGSGRKYLDTVKEYLKKNNIEDRVIFLSGHEEAASAAFRSSADFPGIYQSALALIYPSVFEGFGLPILEALWSGLPAIISNVSCMPETGGDAALYIDPFDDIALAERMKAVATDPGLTESMREKGFAHAQHFTAEKCTAAVMEVYQKIRK